MGRYLRLRISTRHVSRLELRLWLVPSVTHRRLCVYRVADTRQRAWCIHVMSVDRSRSVVLGCGWPHLLVHCRVRPHVRGDRNTYFASLATSSRSLQFLIELHVLL